MRFPKSIRWRLQFWYGTLLVAVLGGFGFTAFQLEHARQFRRVDAGLQERLSMLVDALRAGPEKGGPQRGAPERRPTVEVRLSPVQAALFGGSEGYYFAVWMQGNEPLAASANAPSGIPKPGARDAVTRRRGDLRESFLFAAPVNCVLVGRSVAAEETDLSRLGAVLAGVGAAVLGAGLLGGWWLATRAIRPVEDIAAAAAKIAAGDLSQRIATDEAESELGQLAAVLNSTFARLETSFAQQGRFTADAAHELRTPVAVMLTQTQSALARERPAAEYRETLEACQRATQRMRRLIESLLELARLDAGQERMGHGLCDLSTIADGCIELVGPLAEKRGVRIVAELLPATCRGDGDRIAQVLTNLLTNAIEHAANRVSVKSFAESAHAVLAVHDDGPGIASEDRPHIFERFYRASHSRSDGAQHNGLGLAISQAIVQAHGGVFELAAAGETGTSFVVRLPAAD